MTGDLAPAGRPRWSVVLAVLGVSVASVLPSFLVAATGVRLQAEFGIGDTSLGAMVSTLFLVAGLTSAFAGRLVERAGWRRSVLGAASVAVAVLGGIGLVADQALHVAALLAVGGLVHATGAPAANLALVEEVAPARRGTLFGVKQSAPSLAVLLGGVAVPSLVVHFGWRAAFLASLAVPALALLAVLRDDAPAKTVRSPRPTPRPPPPRGLVLVTLAGAAAAATVTATSSFLVVWAVDTGVGEGTAGLLLALGALASVAARITIGWYADRRDDRDALALVAVLLGLGAVGLLGIATGQTVVLPAGALLAFAAGAGWPGLYQLAVVRRHPETPATATGTVQTGLSLGAATGPLLFGLVSDALTTASAWAMLAVLALAAAALVLVTARRWAAHPTATPSTMSHPSDRQERSPDGTRGDHQRTP